MDVVVVVVVDRFYIKQQQKRSKRRFVSLFSVCVFSGEETVSGRQPETARKEVFWQP